MNTDKIVKLVREDIIEMINRIEEPSLLVLLYREVAHYINNKHDFAEAEGEPPQAESEPKVETESEPQPSDEEIDAAVNKAKKEARKDETRDEHVKRITPMIKEWRNKQEGDQMEKLRELYRRVSGLKDENIKLAMLSDDDISKVEEEVTK